MNDVTRYNQIVIAHAKPVDRSLIEQWVREPHIRPWLHGLGLQTTLTSLGQFFKGSSDIEHWIACDAHVPFAYLLTSPVDQKRESLSSVPFAGRRAITLDVFIGKPDFINRGYGTALIKAFITTHLSDVSDVLIDPEVANLRAVHVYRKIGFRVVETFIAPWHPVPHYLMHLSRKVY